MPQIHDLPAAPNLDRAYSSSVAISKDGSRVLIGDEAEAADTEQFLILKNWKMLLGETKSRQLILAHERNDAILKDILATQTIKDVATEYFSHLLAKIKAHNAISGNPQFVIGIPPMATTETSQWTRLYKGSITDVFRKLGYPDPKFFPEPFAVFQYCSYQGIITDTGSAQNVLIVDIGGGSSNISFIQTTKHGRLARGGGNHVPHAVRSIPMGGSTLDQQIAAHLNIPLSDRSRYLVLNSISAAKEKLSKQLTRDSGWQSGRRHLEQITATIHTGNGNTARMSAYDLLAVFEASFWPLLREEIQSALAEVISKNLQNPVDKVHCVCFSGGTGQIRYLQSLYAKDLLDLRPVDQYLFLDATAYEKAVAYGLAIEAYANARHHQITPSRIAPYLLENVYLLLSHSDHDTIVQDFDGALDKNPSCYRILTASTSLADYIGKPHKIAAKLKQDSHSVHYRIVSCHKGTYEPINLLEKHITVSKKSDPPCGRRLHATISVDDTHFLNIDLNLAFQGAKGETRYTLAPIDIHDLAGSIEGDIYFALDFGTSSTFASSINIKESELVPAQYEQIYKLSEGIVQRALALQQRCMSMKANGAITHERTRHANQRNIVEYVYHSNRVEGSNLTRGQTDKVLAHVADSSGFRGDTVASVIGEEISYLDEHCEVHKVSHAIRDPMDAVNLRDAFRLVEEWAADQSQPLSSSTIKQLHALVARGNVEAEPGVFRSRNVQISQTTHVPPEFLQVEPLVRELVERLNTEGFRSQPVVIQVADFHARFVAIHPFLDGNGRVTRLLVNYLFWRNDMPGLLLHWENRNRYYDALDEADHGNLDDLADLFADQFEAALDEFQQFAERATPFVENDIESPPKIEDRQRHPSVEKLLKKFSTGTPALNLHMQYDNWHRDMTRLASDAAAVVADLESAFKTHTGGFLLFKHYDVVDKESYLAMRKRDRISRTWLMMLTVVLRGKREKLIGYFSANSKGVRELDSTLSFTASLHFTIRSDDGRDTRVVDVPGIALKEIGHDGARLCALVTADGETRLEREAAYFERGGWFAEFLEQFLQHSFGITL